MMCKRGCASLFRQLVHSLFCHSPHIVILPSFLAEEPRNGKRMRHLEVHDMYIQQVLKDGAAEIHKINCTENPADCVWLQMGEMSTTIWISQIFVQVLKQSFHFHDLCLMQDDQWWSWQLGSCIVDCWMWGHSYQRIFTDWNRTRYSQKKS